MPPVPSTSAIAAGYSVQGLQIQVGFGSPPQYQTICNATDYIQPMTAETADVTNVGNLWRSRIPTLLDMEKIKFKIFWVPTEPTHQNAVTGAIYGLRYLYINQLRGAWKVIYPDGNNSTDYFLAYITGFSQNLKVGGAIEAEIEMSNTSLGGSAVVGSSAPQLV